MRRKKTVKNALNVKSESLVLFNLSI